MVRGAVDQCYRDWLNVGPLERLRLRPQVDSRVQLWPQTERMALAIFGSHSWSNRRRSDFSSKTDHWSSVVQVVHHLPAGGCVWTHKTVAEHYGFKMWFRCSWSVGLDSNLATVCSKSQGTPSHFAWWFVYARSAMERWPNVLMFWVGNLTNGLSSQHDPPAVELGSDANSRDDLELLRASASWSGRADSDRAREGNFGRESCCFECVATTRDPSKIPKSSKWIGPEVPEPKKEGL